MDNKSLKGNLKYAPVELSFGTSGLRGLVKDITNLEAYINTLGFLTYALSINDIKKNDEIYIAGDLRISTDRRVAEAGGKGEILQAVGRAIQDFSARKNLNLKTVNLGKIPTPALTYYALIKSKASVMVTGSHIPFDRNGIKFNKSTGEVLKSDEDGIKKAVQKIREEIYNQTFSDSIFDDNGMLKESVKLPPAVEDGKSAYLERYLKYFPPQILKGMNVLFYQHSAVGREIVPDILKKLGANVICVGWSDQFIPIDTEAIPDQQLVVLQEMLDEQTNRLQAIDAIVSTDGDSDRPLVCGVDAGNRAQFFGGDILGLIVRDYLKADAAAVPISANDAVEMNLQELGVNLVKTKIGSPYVIQAMQEIALKSGWGRLNKIKSLNLILRRIFAKTIVAWEANGGFLTGSDIVRKGRRLKALPTRDAVLPILSVLAKSAESRRSLVDLFADLPRRYGKSGIIRPFPTETSARVIQFFSPAQAGVQELEYFSNYALLTGSNRAVQKLFYSDPAGAEILKQKKSLESYFTPQPFNSEENLFQGGIRKINLIDGLRIFFANQSGDIVHLRPSGNAPEFRIYAVSNSMPRCFQIVNLGISDNGLMQQIAQDIQKPGSAVAPFPIQIFKIRGRVQNYEWGGNKYIADLIGDKNPENKPYAEFWMGAHPYAPSIAMIESAETGLDQLIRSSGGNILGREITNKFGPELPYLFKVLDAAKMLSIQAHPTKAQAEAAFNKENDLGVPLSAPNRNYKDQNHKPEIILALTPFYALKGFRPLHDIQNLPAEFMEFRKLFEGFTPAKESLVALYERILNLEQDVADQILISVIDRMKSRSFQAHNREFWVLSAAREYTRNGHFDKGIFSIFLLNFVVLKPGEALYLPAGELHAYLQGTGIELMASSNNVLRGGLTPKHVDVNELLKTLTFAIGPAEVLKGDEVSATEKIYRTDAAEFELSRIHVSSALSHTRSAAHSADCLIAIETEPGQTISVRSDSKELSLSRGEVFFAPAGLSYEISSNRPAVLYRATVPLK